MEVLGTGLTLWSLWLCFCLIVFSVYLPSEGSKGEINTMPKEKKKGTRKFWLHAFLALSFFPASAIWSIDINNLTSCAFFLKWQVRWGLDIVVMWTLWGLGPGRDDCELWSIAMKGLDYWPREEARMSVLLAWPLQSPGCCHPTWEVGDDGFVRVLGMLTGVCDGQRTHSWHATVLFTPSFGAKERRGFCSVPGFHHKGHESPAEQTLVHQLLCFWLLGSHSWNQSSTLL